jgi:hypothetical protein
LFIVAAFFVANMFVCGSAKAAPVSAGTNSEAGAAFNDVIPTQFDLRELAPAGQAVARV